MSATQQDFAELAAIRADTSLSDATMLPAIEKTALVMAAKGGMVSDITVGDCLELLATACTEFPGQTRVGRSPAFYRLLHSVGTFPADAPATVRMFSRIFGGRLSVEQLVDRYHLSCRPIRDLLVDYLRERQPGLDYSSLTGLANALALRFWKDLERHHPGIDTLRLSPEIAAAWKQRARRQWHG
ncbi:hypothetical protein ABZW96_27635 [Nocardia sp. NPDC004168]|uniref:hypothetical protein n=1 Tax=Nocardia sp. NPDC004168 TaxID=3154452 RepID=UPI0033BE72A6